MSKNSSNFTTPQTLFLIFVLFPLFSVRFDGRVSLVVCRLQTDYYHIQQFNPFQIKTILENGFINVNILPDVDHLAKKREQRIKSIV